jgi:hypothetical protein
LRRRLGHRSGGGVRRRQGKRFRGLHSVEIITAGPVFSRRLAVETGERIERDGYAYCDLVMAAS